VDPRLSLPAAHEISHHVESRLRDAFGADTIIYIHVEPGIAYPAENSDHS
jgi:divalent metal cation (Fe/Co/Zn/Cd) transporter